MCDPYWAHTIHCAKNLYVQRNGLNIIMMFMSLTSLRVCALHNQDIQTASLTKVCMVGRRENHNKLDTNDWIKYVTFEFSFN